MGIALGVTAAFAAGSFVLKPTAWADFARFAIGNATASAPVVVFPVPFIVRLPIVMAVIVRDATNSERPWAMVAAAGFASYNLYTWTWLLFVAVAVVLRSARRCLEVVVLGWSTAPRLSWETARCALTLGATEALADGHSGHCSPAERRADSSGSR